MWAWWIIAGVLLGQATCAFSRILEASDPCGDSDYEEACPEDLSCILYGGLQTCGKSYGDICDTSVDCGGNLKCIIGRCLDAGPAVCTKDIECNAPYFYCDDDTGLCTTSKTSFGEACDEDDDCMIDAWCLEGRCGYPPGERCLSSEMCPQSLACEDYICSVDTKSLQLGESCGPKNPGTCRRGLSCVAHGGWQTCGKSFGEECEKDEDCGASLICNWNKNICINAGNAKCSVDDDCPAEGYKCDRESEKCTAEKNTFGQACNVDEQCAGDALCINGICGYRSGHPCDDDIMCPGLICRDHVCADCKPGEYRFVSNIDETKLQCLPCDSDSFTPAAGMSECIKCPYGSGRLTPGASSQDECICKEGFYKENSGQENCTECPVGAYCVGGNSTITAKPGFWVDSYKSGSFQIQGVQSCFPSQYCIQQDGQICADGLGGNICSWCGYDNANPEKPRYFKFFGSCIKCYDQVSNVFLHLAIYLMWIVINVFVAEKYDSIGLAIDWMQIMSIIGGINAGWPVALQNYFSIAALFSFDLDIVSWSCVASEWNFLLDMIVQFALPLCLSLFWILVYYLEWLPRKCRSKPKLIKSSRSMRQNPKSFRYQIKQIFRFIGLLDEHEELSKEFLVAKILVSIEATYLINTYYAFASLRTKNIGGKNVLVRAPYYEQNRVNLAIGILGLVTFSIAFPLFLWVKLASFAPKKKIVDDHSSVQYTKVDHGNFIESHNMEAYGWLYEKFKIEHWALSISHLVHRFIQIAIVVLITDPTVALNASFVFNIIFGVYFMAKNPYNEDKMNNIQGATLISCMIMLLVGIWFNTKSQGEIQDTWLDRFILIIAIVNLGITGVIFFHAMFIQVMERWCYFSVKSYIDFACKRHLPRDVERLRLVDDLLTEISPFRIWSWVNYKVSVLEYLEGKDDEDSQHLYQMHRCDLHDYILISRSVNQYQKENKCMSPHSLSQESVLWRSFLLKSPEILDLIFYGSPSATEHFLSFFKLFYQQYWHPERKYWLKIPSVFKRGINFTLTKVASIGEKPERQTSSEDVTQNVYECDFSTENKITSATHLRSKSSELLRYYSEEAKFENQNFGESSISSVINRKFRPSIAYWLAKHNEHHSKSRIAFQKFMINVSQNTRRSMAEKTMRVLVLNRRSEFMDAKIIGREDSKMFPHIEL